MDWVRFKDIVNLAGSVASITGISLLWLNQLTPSVNLLTAAPFLLIAALLAVGCVALAIFGFQYGYSSLVQDRVFSLKLIYSCFASAALILLLWVALFWIFGIAWVVVRESKNIAF